MGCSFSLRAGHAKVGISNVRLTKENELAFLSQRFWLSDEALVARICAWNVFQQPPHIEESYFNAKDAEGPIQIQLSILSNEPSPLLMGILEHFQLFVSFPGRISLVIEHGSPRL